MKEKQPSVSPYWDKAGSFLIRLYNLFKVKKIQRILAVVQYVLIIAIFWYLINLAGKVSFSGLRYGFILLSSLSVVLLRMTSIYRLRALLQEFKDIPFRTIWKTQSWAILVGLFTPGKAGEGIIVWSLGKGKEEKIKVASLFTLSKLFDGMVYIPFALFFAWKHKEYFTPVLMLVVVFGIILLVYAKVNKLLKLDSKQIWNYRIYAFTLLSLFLQVTGLYLILLSKGIAVSFLTTCLIWSVASIVALLSTLPGGIGARETGISFLLTKFAGIDFSTSLSVSLLHGFVLYSTTLLFAMGSKMVIKESKLPQEQK